MRRTVLGLFKSLHQAERALKEIEASGFANNQISLVAKKVPGPPEKFDYGETTLGNITSGVLHDFDGFLVQAGDIDLPVIGSVTAGGPLAGALIQGDKSLAESLSFYGVSGERGAEIENFVRDGYVLAVIETNSTKASEAANLLDGYGAHHVQKWSKSIDKPLRPGP